MTKLKKILIQEWKQFAEVDIEFHERLTVLTGVNGSGKTSVLNLLSKSFGYTQNELATPIQDENSNKSGYSSRAMYPNQPYGGVIGKICYSNNLSFYLIADRPQAVEYQVKFDAKVNFFHSNKFPGVFVSSHQPTFSYKAIQEISISKISKSKAFTATKSISHHQASGYTLGHITDSYSIKETLLAWAIHGYGSPVMQSDPEQLSFYQGFEQILKDILPLSLGFRRLLIRSQEIVMDTDTGEYILDAASGGLSKIIALAWHIYTFAEDPQQPFTVLIDEIENHLHPAMQRSILPALLRTFPQCQFVVATHSPLVVSSVKDSAVYALRYGDDRHIHSQKLDLAEMTQTATEVLREVLDVPVTLPPWVEEQLDALVAKYN